MKYSVKSFFISSISFKEDILRSADDRGICFCTAHYSTTECTVHLSVRLGSCPILLAMRWPLSLGISNLHNHCWLLLTGPVTPPIRLTGNPEKKCRLPKKEEKKNSLNDFPLSSAAGSESIIFHQVHKNRWLRLIDGGFSGDIVYQYLSNVTPSIHTYTV